MISYIIWDVTPNLFSQFEFLRWYGVCWVIGMALGYQVMQKIYRTEGHSLEELEKLTIYVMLGGIIGARLGHIIFYDPIYYFQNPIEILPIKVNPSFQFTGLAGLASHGGILGALMGLFLYKRKYGVNHLWILDRFMISGVLLGGFIRLGNLMNSEIIGTPSSLPWAFVFTRIDQIPRHPSQLYEAIFYWGVSLLTYSIWRSKKYNESHGFIFGLGMTLIFVQRFLIEFVKENQVAFEDSLTLNMGQLLSIPLMILGSWIMIWSLKKSRPSID